MSLICLKSSMSSMISDSSWPKRSARAASFDISSRKRRLLERPVSSSVTACSETSSCRAMFSIDDDNLSDQVEEDLALGRR